MRVCWILAGREVLISKTTSVPIGMEKEIAGTEVDSDDCSCITEAGFNGGSLFSFNWMRRYKDYMGALTPQIPKIYKVAGGGGRLKFVFLRIRAMRSSDHAIILPIWVGNQFRPVRVRFIGAAPNYY